MLPLIWIIALSSAFAAELRLPLGPLERDRTVSAVYRTAAPARGTLAIRWTDVYGRVVEERTIPVNAAETTFSLDLRRAAAMKNELHARFTAAAPSFSEEARIEFITHPPGRVWWDYQIIMWQPYPAPSVPTLKTLGISAGQYVGRNKPPASFLFDNDLPWYAENIATDFYAQYHRYSQGQRPNWRFYEAKDLYKKDPGSKEAFKRNPSLSDPEWIAKIRERLIQSTQAHSPYRPLFYDLGDESGIADLSAYWDFDFSDHSLREMRVWLKGRYATLAALNDQWGTLFPTWDAVTPQTTDEAMKRTDGNFSSWADFKEWMDVAFARALRMGRDAVQSVDPAAYVGIAGAQMPGWGGYDYAKLTGALNFFEPYDIGNNIEIIRSLAPGTPMVTTSFARGPWEKHRVWYELLHGHRGLIIWDEKFEFANKDGSPGPRGLEAKPYYNEIRGGIGALLIASERQSDPIAIHYSQASFRTDWMLRLQPKGPAWVNRTASTERLDSDFLRLRESYCRLVEDLGLQYNFVSTSQLENGELGKRGYKVLILPDSNSLTAGEAQAIRAFSGRGVVISQSEPGTHDEHSRRLPSPRLGDLRGSIRQIPGDVLNYHQHRLQHKEGPVLEAAGKLIRAAGVTPPFGPGAAGVEVHRFRNGGVTIAALLANPQLRVDELGPPQFKSNERFEKPQSVHLKLPGPMQVYDVRKAASLGRKNDLTAPLDPYEPAVYALSSAAMGDLKVSAPARTARGGIASVTIGIASAAATHVFGVDVVSPAGNIVSQYSGNVLAPRGRAVKAIPFAYNDEPGRWQVRVRDLLSGQARTREIAVE